MHQPHPNWSDEWNDAQVDSDLLGGVFIDKLPVGTVLVVDLKRGYYRIERHKDGFYLLEHWYKGEPLFCPIPTKVNILGSLYHPLGSILRMKFIGRGMFLEFSTTVHPRLISSEVLEITEERICKELWSQTLRKACVRIKKTAMLLFQRLKVRSS